MHLIKLCSMKTNNDNITTIIVIIFLIILGVCGVLIRLDLSVGQNLISTKYLLVVTSVIAAIFGLYLLYASPSFLNKDDE